MSRALKIGVLSLQGAVREHLKLLKSLGAEAVEVKYPRELGDLDGLILPGGESTTMTKLIRKYHFAQPIKDFARDKAVFGTCAGLILISSESHDKRVLDLDIIDLEVDRNAYGTQLDSFETELDIPAIGEPAYHAVFIRAPKISAVGKDVEVLATHNNEPVLVRQGRILGASFHPELTLDHRIHQFFLEMAG